MEDSILVRYTSALKNNLEKNGHRLENIRIRIGDYGTYFLEGMQEDLAEQSGLIEIVEATISRLHSEVGQLPFTYQLVDKLGEISILKLDENGGLERA